MTQAHNLLIQRLPKAARKRLLDQCEPFELVLSAELSVRGQPLSHAYFPQSGFLSLVIDVDTYPALEVGMVGHESMLGSELVLGVAKTPWRALVQGGGHGWRIGANALRQECNASPALRQLRQRRGRSGSRKSLQGRETTPARAAVHRMIWRTRKKRGSPHPRNRHRA